MTFNNLDNPDDFNNPDNSQGFLKHHPSLTSLITHHSVMPELLPVRELRLFNIIIIINIIILNIINIIIIIIFSMI